MYCAGTDVRSLSPAVAAAVQEAVRQARGDVLVFLPGKREIRGVQALLTQRQLPGGTEVLLLHGDLPMEAQDALLAPPPASESLLVIINLMNQSIH